MYKFFRIIFVLYIITAMRVQPAAAQDYFTDTFQQLATPTGIEHNGFWKEMYYANQIGVYKGFTYWAYNNLSTHAAAAAGYLNAVKPTQTSNISAATDETMANILMYVNYCPGEPNAFGCFVTTEWTYVTNQWSVYTWSKASIYIRPNSSGKNWTTVSIRAGVAHELLHGVGLEDQYIYSNGNPACNPNRVSLMDGWTTDANGYIISCDGVYTPALQDITQWDNYMTCCNYEANSYLLVTGDGTSILKWRDNAWTDYCLSVKWQWSASANGPWAQFAIGCHINMNGSQKNVTGATNWLIQSWINPGFYGIHQKYIKAKAFPKYNHTDVESTETDSSVFFYPY